MGLTFEETAALVAVEEAARRVNADCAVPSLDSTCALDDALQRLDAVRKGAPVLPSVADAKALRQFSDRLKSKLRGAP